MAPRKLNKAQEDRVASALAAVKSGMHVKTAAIKFDVPRTTLRHRLNGKRPQRGPSTILTNDEENLLSAWIINSARKGFPRRKLDVVESVKEFLRKQSNKETLFSGRKWFISFLKRHPEIAERSPEGISAASGNVNETDIRKWFQDVSQVLEEENVQHVLRDPDRVFNADETNFKLCPEKTRVLAEKGAKNIYEIDQGNSKFAITAMFAYSASGKTVDPMLIYPYERIPSYVVKSVPASWGIGRSANGWMTAETFYEWIGNIFTVYLTTNKVKRPVILFVDGHKTHLTRETSELCKTLEITLVALYPNATHILQPCDVAAFRPLKSEWYKSLLIWRKSHPNEAVTKSDIAPILEASLKKDFSTTIRNGFRATGLYPFNPDAVDFSKCKGHIKEKEVHSISCSTEGTQTTLKVPEFRKLVGEKLMKNIEQMKEEPQNEELAALFRLYKFFGEKPIETQGTRIAPVLEADAFCDDPQPVAKTVDPEPVELSSASTTSTSNVFERIPVNLNIVREEPMSDEERLPNVGYTSSDSPDLKDVLAWPHSPKRKGKKQLERMPYVVTSKRWRDIQVAKDRKKEEEALEKTVRLQERIRKRAAKESAKGRRKPQTRTNPKLQ